MSASVAVDPASNIAAAIQEGIAAALVLQNELNTPAMIAAATAAAIAAINAKYAADEAAFEQTPTDPATLAKEREELS